MKIKIDWMMVAIAVLCVSAFAIGAINWSFKQDELNLQLAITPEQQLKGLSGLSSMPENSGMLFVFKGEAIRCMWGKDMKFPVDVGFLDSSNRLINVATIPAGDTAPICSKRPAQEALEMNVGRFSKHRRI